MTAQIIHFPDRRSRAQDELVLDFMRWREARALKVIVDDPPPYVSTREIFDSELSAIGARAIRVAVVALVILAIFIAASQTAFSLGYRDGLAMRAAPVPAIELSNL